jgi:hypothetical protein
MPWKNGQPNTTINRLRVGTRIVDDGEDDDGDDGEDDDVDDEHNGGEEGHDPAIRLKPKPVAKMTKAELILQLTNRNVSTEGFAPDLRTRLVRIFDGDRERSWIRDDSIAMNIQLDNATPHSGRNNMERLRVAGLKKGFTIRPNLQPPRSPDLNKCDMSIFALLGKRASNYKVKSKTLEDLIVNVTQAFEEFPIDALERTYAQCFEVYRCILKNDGGIDYATPHSGINNRQRRGEPLVDYFVDVALVERARVWLEANPLW